MLRYWGRGISRGRENKHIQRKGAFQSFLVVAVMLRK